MYNSHVWNSLHSQTGSNLIHSELILTKTDQKKFNLMPFVIWKENICPIRLTATTSISGSLLALKTAV